MSSIKRKNTNGLKIILKCIVCACALFASQRSWSACACACACAITFVHILHRTEYLSLTKKKNEEIFFLFCACYLICHCPIFRHSSWAEVRIHLCFIYSHSEEFVLFRFVGCCLVWLLLFFLFPLMPPKFWMNQNRCQSKRFE